MSELQRAWARAKITNLTLFDEATEDQDGHRGAGYMEEEDEEEDRVPELPAAGGNAYEGDDSSSASSASSASSTGTIIPSPSRNLFARPGIPKPSRSYEQIPWTSYFERELFLTPSTTTTTTNADGDSTTPQEQIIYHAYLTSPSPGGPLFVTHHGAGSSGLSFAVLASEIKKLLPNAGILSPDARGHGLTTITPPVSTAPDLSLPTLTSDLHNILNLTAKQMSWPILPPLILVGHSLGGAITTSLASTPSLTPPSLLAYAVLDVVEGSAIDALASMTTYLSTRPTGFHSLKEGIEWHVRSRTIRSSVSARTSVPALLVNHSQEQPPRRQGDGEVKAGPLDSIEETSRGGDDDISVKSSDTRPWKWRTNLSATQPFWEGWFVGLSKKFLTGRGGKLLLLAGTDRLDTELTIGQMQGKYALQVFPEAGHFIHEDLPEKTAVTLVDFYRRNDRSTIVMPPKVSDLLRQGKRV